MQIIIDYYIPTRIAKRIRLTIARAGEDKEQLDLLCIAGGNWKGTNTLETFGVSHKVKHKLTLWATSTPGYLHKRKENLCLQKDLYLNVHRSFTYNCLKQETAQISINMDKQMMASTKCFSTEMDHINIPQWDEPQKYWHERSQNKSLHTTWFHLYGVLQHAKLNYCDRNCIRRCLGYNKVQSIP